MTRLYGFAAFVMLTGAAVGASAQPTTVPASPPTVAAAPDAVRGAARFKAICGSCHTIDPAKRSIGPHLKGVIGRKAGSVDGFSYSPALKAAGWNWDAARLDPYLARPANVVKGTKMVNIVANPKDRADIIAYLATVK